LNAEPTNAKLRTIIRLMLEMGENAVRPANQNAPIYKGEEYITVHIVSEHAEGTDETYWEDTDDRLVAIEHLSGVRLTSASIQYYNGDAYERLRVLSSRLQSYFASEMMSDAGFGFVAVSSVQDLTGLLPDEIWQSRAVMRFDFYVEVNDTVRTPLIVTLPLTIYTHDGQQRHSEVTA
jgi:hypothetical protein